MYYIANKLSNKAKQTNEQKTIIKAMETELFQERSQ